MDDFQGEGPESNLEGDVAREKGIERENTPPMDKSQGVEGVMEGNRNESGREGLDDSAGPLGDEDPSSLDSKPEELGSEHTMSAGKSTWKGKNGPQEGQGRDGPDSGPVEMVHNENTSPVTEGSLRDTSPRGKKRKFGKETDDKGRWVKRRAVGLEENMGTTDDNDPLETTSKDPLEL